MQTEHVLILYNPNQGTEPTPADIESILSTLGPQAGGLTFGGAAVSCLGYDAEISRDLAMAVVAKRESDGLVSPGALGRSLFYLLTADGESVAVAVVQKNSA